MTVELGEEPWGLCPHGRCLGLITVSEQAAQGIRPQTQACMEEAVEGRRHGLLSLDICVRLEQADRHRWV